MCLEIIAKENKDYLIKYVPGCIALTDAPYLLINWLKQRRRWFNGSMFATFEVVSSMCRTWERSDSFFRNILFMIFYLYMVINVVIGFVLVGMFYASFSIFLRAAFPSSNCPDMTKLANILENIYLVFLFFILVFSASVKLEWCDLYFRVVSIFMGVFSVLMLVAVIISIVQLEFEYITIIAFGIVVFVYILPMLLHFGKIKKVDFFKGLLYVFFMSPTYINIMTIFAICNIHDVSWGSRPKGTKEVLETAREENMKIEYKNYRSNFLIIWVIINMGAGSWVVNVSRGNQEYFLLIITAILGFILLVKCCLSLCHFVMAMIHN